MKLENALRSRKCGFRTFDHPEAKMRELITRARFDMVFQRRTAVWLSDRSVSPRCYGFLVANPMITRAPAMAIAAPTASVNVGRCPSTAHSHISDAAM